MHSSVEILGVIHSTARNNPPSIRLTPRGAEVFALIQAGVSDKCIGERLGISYSAVRRHREKMLYQNKCNSMLELIAKNVNPHAKVPHNGSE